MTRIHPAVCGARVLAIAAVAWGVVGSAPAGEPAHDTTSRRLAQGRELFEREWVPNDPRSHGGDGLGPLYNETSCVSCHNQGGLGGAGAANKNVEVVTLTFRSRHFEKGRLREYHPSFVSTPSVLLHRNGTDLEYTLWRLRRVCGVEVADIVEQGGPEEMGHLRRLLGLTVSPTPSNPISRLGQGKGVAAAQKARGVKGDVFLADVATFSQRSPLALFGVGLIESIPVEALIEAASNPPASLRGRVSRLKDGRIGRFGWKAQTANLKDFVESACAMELGLEVPTHHQARSPLDLAENAKSAGLDLTQDECDALTAFVARLPAPIERGAENGPNSQPDAAKGRALFSRIGCAVCHLPKLGPVEGIYSDLLLHDLGASLSDAGGYYEAIDPSGETAKAQEWRTPPLWGFRDSAPYLHDGRAETLSEAVALHGGQGESSARQFFELNPRERLQVQTFLNTLVAPAP